MAVIQDGRCEYGNVGREIQRNDAGEVRSQPKVLPVRLHRGLLHSSLPVAEADDLHVGKVAAGNEASVLRYEMTKKTVIIITMVFILIIKRREYR